MLEVIAFRVAACQVARRLPLGARAVDAGLLPGALVATHAERAARHPATIPEQQPPGLHVCGVSVPLRGRRGDIALRPLAYHTRSEGQGQHIQRESSMHVLPDPVRFPFESLPASPASRSSGKLCNSCRNPCNSHANPHRPTPPQPIRKCKDTTPDLPKTPPLIGIATRSIHKPYWDFNQIFGIWPRLET